MIYRKNLKSMLTKLHVPNAGIVMDAIFMDDHHFALQLGDIEQTGGSGDMPKYKKLPKNMDISDKADKRTAKSVKIKYNLNDSKYYFTVYQTDYVNKIAYSVFSNNNKNAECSIISYEIKNQCCYIESISALDKCYDQESIIGLKYNRTGTLILKFTLEFIELHLTKIHKIKYMWLKDNSNKTCSIVGDYIPLDTFYMFTHGDTWYGKYGFVPFDKHPPSTDEMKEMDYKKNQKIVKDTMIGNIDIHDIFTDAVFKANETAKKDIIPIKSIPILLEKYKKHTVMRFISNMCTQYDKMCIVFYYLYKPLMKKLGMSNLHNTTYWKQL